MEWLEDALKNIKEAPDLGALEAVRISILGKKGRLTEEFSKLKELDSAIHRICLIWWIRVLWDKGDSTFCKSKK